MRSTVASATSPTRSHRPNCKVEQRWFAGAHSNIGGGYRSDSLAQLPLQWIQKCAAAADLRFRHEIQLLGDEHTAPVVDSYAKFLKGVYRALKFGKRNYRDVGKDREKVTGGWIEPHYETIDSSVFDKWRSDDGYRPENLKRWAEKNNFDPAEQFNFKVAHTNSE